MRVSCWLTAVSLGALLAGSAFAQTTRYGDPDWTAEDAWRSGMPVVLTAGTQDVQYAFDGNPLEIPFTISGTRATVYLAVYTSGANPQYGGDPFGTGGIGGAVLRAAGIDTLVSLSAGQSFDAGSHTIVWDGNDFNGNAVAPGNYDFFLIAIDDVSKPTWTGRGSYVWSSRAYDFRFDPPVVWNTNGNGSNPEDGSFEQRIERTPLGTDLHANPEADTDFLMPWMIPRLREINAEANPDQWDISFVEIDPQDPNVAYVGNYGCCAGLPGGFWKVNIDLDNVSTSPEDSFGDRGHIVWEQRVFDAALMAEHTKEWLSDDGLIYMSHMDREEPFTPQIVMFDRATGDIANVLDLTDLMVQNRPDTDTPDAPYVCGPSGVDVDDTGIYATAYWMQAPRAFPTKYTQDGDILWQNQNGDGFIDRYTGEEAEALGIVVIDQMVNTDISVTRHGVTFAGGYNDPAWGYIFGPDGHGLLILDLPYMPPHLGGEVLFIDRGSEFDGLTIPVDGYMGVHWPFDMVKASISEGETSVAEVEGAVPAAFAVSDAAPNPFNPETSFRVSIPETGGDLHVHIAVYNTAGQQVAVLADEPMRSGVYEATWDGRDMNGRQVSSGVYLYTVRAGADFVESKRMTLLK